MQGRSLGEMPFTHGKVHRHHRDGIRAESRKKRHPVLGHPTINTGIVRGGSQPNIVPDVCEADLDRRTLPGVNRLQRSAAKSVRC